MTTFELIASRFWGRRQKGSKPATTPPADLYAKAYDRQTGEVRVSTTISLKDYERITPKREMARLKSYAAAMEGKKLIFINATYAGGGVAIMRAPLIALLRCLGVDAHWYVLKPDAEAFKVTKTKFHNVLQDVAAPDVALNAKDKLVYESWIEQNAQLLAGPLSAADVIVIDDWQPSGLIPFIKGQAGRPGLNPQAKLIFRNHIHSEGGLMVKPGTPQHTTWQYVWEHNRVREVELFLAHPRPEFVPPNVPKAKVVYMPASCDLLGDLNRPLSATEARAGLAFVNVQLAALENQTPLDVSRPFMTLIARFDPSKGMPQGLAAFASARRQLARQGLPASKLPQFVLFGNGSVDDPDGIPMLAEMMRLRREEYSDIKDDIKIARAPHNDLALNALLSQATLALQPSTKEGFEMAVTDAILHGVPVIGSNKGGIPLQIVDGRSGFVIDPDFTDQWAKRICQLLTDDKKLRYMRHQAKLLAKKFNHEFTTVPNAINWLYLSTALLTKPQFAGRARGAKQMVQDVLINNAQH